MLKDYGTLWGFHEKPSKHLTVFSTETVNIKNLANLTANTKNYGQITLNTKPHSDPQKSLRCTCIEIIVGNDKAEVLVRSEQFILS